MSLRRRIFALVVILATTVVLWQGAIRAQSVPASDIRTLMADLSDVKTTRRDTVTRILQVASKDPSAREYVLQKLPEMIEAGTDEPWLNAIRLAGQMKAVEAIPSLMQEMSRRTFPAVRPIGLSASSTAACSQRRGASARARGSRKLAGCG